MSDKKPDKSNQDSKKADDEQTKKENWLNRERNSFSGIVERGKAMKMV